MIDLTSQIIKENYVLYDSRTGKYKKSNQKFTLGPRGGGLKLTRAT